MISLNSVWSERFVKSDIGWNFPLAIAWMYLIIIFFVFTSYVGCYFLLNRILIWEPSLCTCEICWAVLMWVAKFVLAGDKLRFVTCRLIFNSHKSQSSNIWSNTGEIQTCKQKKRAWTNEGHVIDKVPSKIYRAKENVACPKYDFLGLQLSDFTFNTWYMEVWVV